MIDIGRFLLFMIAAAIVFVAVVLYVTRRRPRRPPSLALLLTTLVVVAGGMLFARYGHVTFRLPWWIYYSVPATLTLLLPPLMFRMTRGEAVRYVVLAFVMAPAIHIVFSLFVGWHDYMPFPMRIPSIAELVRRSLH